MAVDDDGVVLQGEVLASLQNVHALTHACFSIASDASPWRERERERERGVSLVAFELVG